MIICAGNLLFTHFFTDSDNWLLVESKAKKQDACYNVFVLLFDDLCASEISDDLDYCC